MWWCGQQVPAYNQAKKTQKYRKNTTILEISNHPENSPTIQKAQYSKEKPVSFPTSHQTFAPTPSTKTRLLYYQNNNQPHYTMATRRKSTVSVNRNTRTERPHEESAALELERLEQETTLVLQEIDLNLSQANAIINDKIFPILKKYASATGQVWTNVGFWKHFLEEAADVEISTFEEKIMPERTIPEKSPNALEQEIQPEIETSPEPQIEASTPQLRSRGLLASPQIVTMRKSATGYLKVAVSPKKRTPRREDARRLSLLQNFLNSLPTLPEPPVLLSEIGRMATSSSSVVRPTVLSSDRDLRLLPVPVTLTPRQDGMQRFPRTPNFSSSASKPRGRNSATHTPLGLRLQFNEGSDPPAPTATAAASDDSEEVPVPALQTIQVTGLKRGGSSNTASPKKRRTLPDDPENVFLDVNNNLNNNSTSRNNSTVYHTIVHDAEERSRSISHILDEVLSADAGAGAASTGAPTGTTGSTEPAQDTNEFPAVPGRDNTHNLSHSIDTTVNSSDLGSFLGERWKALSKTLRK